MVFLIICCIASLGLSWYAYDNTYSIVRVEKERFVQTGFWPWEGYWETYHEEKTWKPYLIVPLCVVLAYFVIFSAIFYPRPGREIMAIGLGILVALGLLILAAALCGGVWPWSLPIQLQKGQVFEEWWIGDYDKKEVLQACVHPLFLTANSLTFLSPIVAGLFYALSKASSRIFEHVGVIKGLTSTIKAKLFRARSSPLSQRPKPSLAYGRGGKVALPPPPTDETVIRGPPLSSVAFDIITQSGEVRCSECGSLNDPSSRYCRNCGKRLMVQT
jgi:hypothetical protein